MTSPLEAAARARLIELAPVKTFVPPTAPTALFSISDYDNKTRVFAGLSNGGSKIPSGTYFYKIALPNVGKTLTGFIDLRY